MLEEELRKEGHQMVENLQKASINASLVPFSSAYAFMSRINKIFLGNLPSLATAKTDAMGYSRNRSGLFCSNRSCFASVSSLGLHYQRLSIHFYYAGAHSIMKNGGMLGYAGSLLIATAAKSYSVPIIILASTIKLTPHFPFEQNTFNEILNPKDVLLRPFEPSSSHLFWLSIFYS